MRLWRVSPGREFHSESSRKYGARWNKPGTDVIYAAATLALATLEFLVHVDRSRAPGEVMAHFVDVPDDVRIEDVKPASLPEHWDRHPGPEELQELGSAWAEARTTLLLALPPAVLRVDRELIPAERNFLVNPAHPDFARLRPSLVPFALDPRMWK